MTAHVQDSKRNRSYYATTEQHSHSSVGWRQCRPVCVGRKALVCRARLRNATSTVGPQWIKATYQPHYVHHASWRARAPPTGYISATLRTSCLLKSQSATYNAPRRPSIQSPAFP